MSDELRVIVYFVGLTPAPQACTQALDRENLRFSTFYPGGLFGSCSFFVPTPFVGSTEFRAGRRVAIFSGTKMIWEGEIDSVIYTSNRSADGIQIGASGKWGTILNKMRWDKVWCDTRITEAVWPVIDVGNAKDCYTYDRYDRLRIEPKLTGITQYYYGGFSYTMPGTQTIARITCDVDFSEGTQTWRGYLYDYTGTAFITDGSIVATGTAAWDLTPPAGCQTVHFRLLPDAAGTTTVADANTVWCELTNIKIYGETGTISMSEVVKDIRNQLSVLSVVAIDENLIATNAQELEPCFMENETYGEFLNRLASFGDTDLNPWAAGLDVSQKSYVADYQPMLYFEQQPDLSDYEYTIRVDETEGGVKIEIPYDEVRNYISFEYTDINGDRVTVTPDDDANLTDADSVSLYGRKDAFLKLGDVGTTEANNYARRYLDWFKDPHPRMSTPLVVKGHIRTKANDIVPVSWIRAGKRVRIENYLQEIGGAGLIFIITETEYDEDSGRLTISSGSPDPLEVVAARRRGI